MSETLLFLSVLASTREVLPNAVSFGEALYEDSVLEKLCAGQTPAPEVFNWLAHRWHKSYGAL